MTHKSFRDRSASSFKIRRSIPAPCSWALSFLVFGSSLAWAENNSNYVFNGTPGAFTTLNIPMTSPGTNDSLQILNGGSVAVSGNTFLGPGTSDNNNYIVVTGTNLLGVASTLSTVGDLYLGYSGSGNQLIITNVGVVRDSHGFVGYQVAGASNNTVLVSGTGSVWSNNNYMILGDTGNGNSLTIANGGRVDALYVQMGFSDNNNALVTGSGSLWSLPTSSMEVGISGASNRLTIANSGTVSSFDGYLSIAYTTAHDNSVVVTDPGSIWTNSSQLFVGFSGYNNSLIVTNGGQVYNNANAYVGFQTSASNNTIMVAGTNSLWNNSGTTYLGYNGGGNSLIITNGGRVNGAGSFTIVAYLSPSSGNNNVSVSGSGSTWSNSNYMIFGDTGGNNQMTIANSGRVDVLYALIGYSDSNSVLVTDTASVCTMPA